jgi:uncharacterized glyoxalase superfamily protein PhnB
MRPNRSVPTSSVVPVLLYADVPAASDWLCDAFGFRERLRIGEHRAQLVYGNGAVILVHGDPAPSSVHVRVEDAEAHHHHAKERGVQIASEPADYPYGERQYTAVDLGGHRWTFSESIADVDPRSWGATRVGRFEESRQLSADEDSSDWIRVFSAPDDPDVMQHL